MKNMKDKQGMYFRNTFSVILAHNKIFSIRSSAETFFFINHFSFLTTKMFYVTPLLSVFVL